MNPPPQQCAMVPLRFYWTEAVVAVIPLYAGRAIVIAVVLNGPPLIPTAPFVASPAALASYAALPSGAMAPVVATRYVTHCAAVATEALVPPPIAAGV